jgi:hypothetical protein
MLRLEVCGGTPRLGVTLRFGARAARVTVLEDVFSVFVCFGDPEAFFICSVYTTHAKNAK